jgi:hypothetical protein
MELQAAGHRCINCNDAITMPICTCCLAKRMRRIIDPYDQKLAEEVRGIPVDGETTCLFCGEGMGLCAHCFSRDVYDYVEEKNPSVARIFLSRFDFDLRRALL